MKKDKIKERKKIQNKPFTTDFRAKIEAEAKEHVQIVNASEKILWVIVGAIIVLTIGALITFKYIENMSEIEVGPSAKVDQKSEPLNTPFVLNS